MSEQDWFELIHNFIKVCPKMTNEAQNAVAGYLSYQTAPKIIIKQTGADIEEILNGKKKGKK